MILLIVPVIIFILIFLLMKEKTIEGLQVFTGKYSIDDQYYYDKLFTDVAYYPNKEDGTTGWIDCKQNCPGNCVEFGPSGNSYCFPY